ncbi:MAG: hypothetical protein IPG17_29465 [Sandaracinaceae bacterium]|nr:hypothetical protein [Sandaracinaceae bacterium]
MALAHDHAELPFEYLHEAGAVGGGELLEERAGLAHLLRQCLGEHAALRAKELLELLGQDTLVVDERRQALCDLAILWVEEAREHRPDRLLLLLDVDLELLVDIAEEGRPHVLQLRLLGSLVSVGERTEADGPRVVRELVARGLVEIAEQGDAVGTAIAQVEGHLLGGE